jgi:hypothetical protein
VIHLNSLAEAHASAFEAGTKIHYAPLRMTPHVSCDGASASRASYSLGSRNLEADSTGSTPLTGSIESDETQ